MCVAPKQDMLVIMGDFYARVGCDVIGKIGANKKNSNGDRLLDC